MRRLFASLRVLWRYGRIHAVSTGAAWVIGFFFGLFLTTQLSGAVMMAAMTALICNAVFTLYGGAFVWTTNLQELLHFGVKRKTAVLACGMMTLGLSLALLAGTFLLSIIGAGRACWVFLPPAAWLGFIPAGMVMWMLSALAAVVILRFGYTGLSVMYMLFMGLMLAMTEAADMVIAVAAAYPLPLACSALLLLLGGGSFSLWRLYKISA